MPEVCCAASGCKNRFKTKTGSGKIYCSSQCRGSGFEEKRISDRVMTVCACGEEFYSRTKSKKYCSEECKRMVAAAAKADKLSESRDESAVQSMGIKAEVSALKAQNKRLLKRAAIVDRIFNYAASQIDPLVKLDIKPPKVSQDTKKKAKYGAFLFATDHHWGIKFESRDVGGLPSYNNDEACRRLKRIVDVTHMWTTREGVYIPECHVFWGGDAICGVIHKSLFREDDGHVIDQVITGAWVYGQMLRELATKYERVVVHCVPGNHGRSTEFPTSEGVYQNFDTLLYQLCKSLLFRQTNIEFQISDKHWLHAEIEGHGIVMLHGDRGIKGVTTNSAYPVNNGLLKSIFALEHTLSLQGKKFDHVAMGHFHTPLEVPYKNGHIQLNGSLPGFDPYSVNNGYFPRPSCQILQLYSEKHGHAATMKIWPEHHGLGDSIPYQFRNLGPNGLKAL